MHPLDQWFESLEPVVIRDQVCLRVPGDPWSAVEHAAEMPPDQVVVMRCVLGLDHEAVEELLPYLQDELLDRDLWEDLDPDEVKELEALENAWRTPLETLMNGAELSRQSLKGLWGFSYEIGSDGMMGGTSGYQAERFTDQWALVTDDGWYDTTGPLRIPLGLVPVSGVETLAPLLIHLLLKGVDWGFDAAERLPFSWMSGDPVQVYRFLLVADGVDDAIYDLSDKEFVRAYPKHPRRAWGLEEIKELVGR